MRDGAARLLALAAIVAGCHSRSWRPLEPGESSDCPLLPLKTCRTTAGALRAEDADRWGGAARIGQSIGVTGQIHYEMKVCLDAQYWGPDACPSGGKGAKADIVLGSVRLTIHEACHCGLEIGGRHCPGSYASDVMVTGRYQYDDPKDFGRGGPTPVHVIDVERMCAIRSDDD